jgi:hypothetical protein
LAGQPAAPAFARRAVASIVADLVAAADDEESRALRAGSRSLAPAIAEARPPAPLTIEFRPGRASAPLTGGRPDPPERGSHRRIFMPSVPAAPATPGPDPCQQRRGRCRKPTATLGRRGGVSSAQLRCGIGSVGSGANRVDVRLVAGDPCGGCCRWRGRCGRAALGGPPRAGEAKAHLVGGPSLTPR